MADNGLLKTQSVKLIDFSVVFYYTMLPIFRDSVMIVEQYKIRKDPFANFTEELMVFEDYWEVFLNKYGDRLEIVGRLRYLFTFDKIHLDLSRRLFIDAFEHAVWYEEKEEADFLQVFLEIFNLLCGLHEEFGGCKNCQICFWNEITDRFEKIDSQRRKSWRELIHPPAIES